MDEPELREELPEDELEEDVPTRPDWLELLEPDWLDRLEDELDMLTWPQTGCSQGYSIHNSSSLTTRLPGLWS